MALLFLEKESIEKGFVSFVRKLFSYNVLDEK